MPLYKYECMKERGGCGQTWKESKEMSQPMVGVMCPSCMCLGEEKDFYDKKTASHLSRIQILMPERVHIRKDIDSQDGRSPGDKIAMPSLGKDVSVGSRRELADAKKRAREEGWNQTYGEHTATVPVPKDPEDPNSPVTWEKVTKTKPGWDMGEIVEIEDNRPNEPKNAFKDVVPGETLSQAEEYLEKRVGTDPEPAPVRKRRGRPKGSKDKAPRKRRGARGKA